MLGVMDGLEIVVRVEAERGGSVGRSARFGVVVMASVEL